MTVILNIKRRPLLTVFFILFISGSALAQGNSGRGFPFQGIARDASGNILKGENLELRISLLATNASREDWVETHAISTDEFGVFSLIIGSGVKFASNNGINTYADLNFRVEQYWVKVELKDGNSWILLTTQKLLSVPYAENTFTMPIGTIIAFGGNLEAAKALENEGWYVCDGREVSRDEFATLFSITSSNWGQEGTDFRLPDLQGLFLRGLDLKTAGQERDIDRDSRTNMYVGGASGRNVGSYQRDAFQGHQPRMFIKGNSGSNNLGFQHAPNNDGQAEGHAKGIMALGDYGEPRVSKETRPSNAYVIYLIKAK